MQVVQDNMFFPFDKGTRNSNKNGDQKSKNLIGQMTYNPPNYKKCVSSDSTEEFLMD